MRSFSTKEIISFLLSEVSPSEICAAISLHYGFEAARQDTASEAGKKDFERWREIQEAAAKAQECFSKINI